MEAQLQRVVTLCTSEAAEYERAQRLGLLQTALDAMAESVGQQQAAAPGNTQRANVLLRPLAATGEQADGAAQATPALAAAADAAGMQAAPATGNMLPTPLLMTPAGATLLQTPATNAAAWAALRGPTDASAALGLTPAVALAAGGVRPVAAFPHFMSGMMATPLMQPGRPGRPGDVQQAAEADDGKTSKKRQGYHIEPAALQKLIEKQQLEAQRKEQQKQQRKQQKEAAAAAAAAAAAGASSSAAPQAAAAANGGSGDEPPPRQQQQQHRPRVLSRLPPQVREQAERHAAERARKLQQAQEAEDAAAAAAADGSGSRQASAVGGSSATQQQPQQQQQPVTAADCLESPNGAGLGGLRLPVGSDLHPQAQDLPLDLESAKLFGSAQKRLRLSLCDDNGALLPGGQPLISPVVLPTPSPAIAAASAAGPPTLAGAGAGGDAAAAAGSSASGGAAGGAAGSQEAPTPSKFFTGSPVPQTERRALGGHRDAPETPVALVAGAQAAHVPDVQQALLEGTAGQGSREARHWVPVPGQAPAVLGATPLPAATPASGGEEAGGDLTLDPAAAAAMPVPESPAKQGKDAGAGQQGNGQQGSWGDGSGEGGMVLQTPAGQEQAVAGATPGTALS